MKNWRQSIRTSLKNNSICEDSFHETVDYMAEILDDYEPNPTAPDTGGFNPSFLSSSHLPKINLPTFDFRGFDKWENFRDRFKLMILDDSLTNIDRMHYLFSCLTGEASNTLTNLAVINSNFPVAWNMLVSRYKNKHRLITTHLRSLSDLPSFTTETSNDLLTLHELIS